MAFFHPVPQCDPPFRIEVATRLAELSDAPWDALRGAAGLYQHRGWWAATADMATGPVRYVSAWHTDEGCCGVVPLYLFPPSVEAGAYDPRFTLGVDIAETLGVADRFSVLGGRVGYLTRWTVSCPLSERASVISTIVSGAGRACADLEASLLSIQFLPRDDAQVLVNTGLVRDEELVPQTMSAQINLPGITFGDYLSELSAARRSIVRRDLDQFEASGLRLVSSRLSEALDYAPRLLANTQAHHGMPAEVELIHRILTAQAHHLDTASLALAAVDPDGAVVACSLSYIVDAAVYVRVVGLDYARSIASAAYFVTAYYGPIREAYRRGLRTVHLGIASLRPKVLRGASLEPLFGVFRRRDGLGITTAQAAGIRQRFHDRLNSQLRGIAGALAMRYS